MLALKRKVGESIQIGGDVTVTIVAIKGGAVRLGIDAPTATRVIRAELLDVVTIADVARRLDTAAVTLDDAQDLADYLQQNLGQKRGDND